MAVRLNSNKKIMIAIGIAAVLLFLTLKPVSIPSREAEIPVIMDNITNDIDCNGCKRDDDNTITLINPDPSRTYYVWLQGIFEGEFTTAHTFKSTCNDQIIACYSDQARSDTSCDKDLRIKGKFSCTEQTIIIK